MPRAGGKGGFLILRGLSADGGQPVVGNIVPNGMGKDDGLTIKDGRDINAATSELVDKCLVMIY